jgi:ribA/ribD-fused uncharacterized protein|tara:strand:- start:108 stop:626 length:519 start_codon:yes stop_codon:yes gene_type:complete
MVKYMKEEIYCYDDENVVFGFHQKGHEYLSNFYECPCMYRGAIFPSSENAYQAAKIGVDLNSISGKDLLGQLQDCSPRESKALGKKIPIRKDWDNIKDRVMAIVVLDKFVKNIELAEVLLETGNKSLVEANHWGDLWWGVDYQLKQGRNQLGKTLMGVRSLLKMINSPRYNY